MYWKVRIKFNDSSYSLHVGCATDETKLWLSLSAKQCRNPCCGSPPVYQDLSTRHDWPVKKAIVDFSNRLKRNSKRFCGNSLSQDLSLCHDWPVKKAIVDLSNMLKGNSKRFSCNWLSQDLSLCHDWPVKKAIVDLSNTLKGNSKCFSCNSLSQDLSLWHDWPVKKTIVDLSNRLKGNSKCFFGNSLSPLEAQNKDFRRCFTDVTNWGWIMSTMQATTCTPLLQRTGFFPLAL